MICPTHTKYFNTQKNYTDAHLLDTLYILTGEAEVDFFEFIWSGFFKNQKIIVPKSRKDFL